MELVFSANLIFILAVNILFFFSGICLNSLVIVSFWRSVQLRKKLCHFMIMVLSCCDLLVILTNHPFTALISILWLTEKINAIHTWMEVLHASSDMSLGLSQVGLFVMSFERYLGSHYPIFHRTSVTKGKLLTLFTFFVIFQLTATAMSINNLVISYHAGLLIFNLIYIPAMLFINYKLFRVARKNRRNNRISPEMRKSFSLKNISSCLLAVACLILLAILSIIYIGLSPTTKTKEYTLNNARIAGLWFHTVSSMNATFNCLIFYWKNKTLRTEGIRLLLKA